MQFGRKRKIVELSTGNIVIPDIEVEIQPIQQSNWEDGLVRVKEDQYEKVEGDAEPSPEYDIDAHSQTSMVSVNAETRLRLL